MANVGNYNKDNELVKEFSTLIGNIAAEVTNQVAKNTVLKDVKELQSVSNGLQLSAPKMLQTLKQANMELEKTKKASVNILTDFNNEVAKSQKLTQKAMETFYAAIDTSTNSNQKIVNDSILKMTKTVEASVKTVNQETKTITNEVRKNAKESVQHLTDVSNKTLAEFSTLFAEQNTKLKENLDAASEKYNQLSTGSYQAYKKAMVGQTKEIVEPLRQLLEQNNRLSSNQQQQLIKFLDSQQTDTLNCAREAEERVLQQIIANNNAMIKNVSKVLQKHENLAGQLNFLKKQIDEQIIELQTSAEKHYRNMYYFMILIFLVLVGIRIWDKIFA